MRPVYRLARQRHIGDMLDYFHREGVLLWRFDFDDNRAVYWIALTNEETGKYYTSDAELLVQWLCSTKNIVWRAVESPGGEAQRESALQWMDDHRDSRVELLERPEFPINIQGKLTQILPERGWKCVSYPGREPFWRYPASLTLGEKECRDRKLRPTAVLPRADALFVIEAGPLGSPRINYFGSPSKIIEDFLADLDRIEATKFP